MPETHGISFGSDEASLYASLLNDPAKTCDALADDIGAKPIIMHRADGCVTGQPAACTVTLNADGSGSITPVL